MPQRNANYLYCQDHEVNNDTENHYQLDFLLLLLNCQECFKNIFNEKANYLKILTINV